MSCILVNNAKAQLMFTNIFTSGNSPDKSHPRNHQR